MEGADSRRRRVLPVEITCPGQCGRQEILHHQLPLRVCRLAFTNAGEIISSVFSSEPHDATHLLAINNDHYGLSISGGEISLFDYNEIKNIKRPIVLEKNVMPTALVFHPEKNNLFAVGTANADIVLYELRGLNKEIQYLLTVKQYRRKKITGLAFLTGLPSSKPVVVVAAMSNFTIVVQSFNEHLTSEMHHITPPRLGAEEEDIRLQVHKHHKHILIFSESLLEIRNVPTLDDHAKRPYDTSYGTITHAAFSCDGEKVFASFTDGSVCVFEALSLQIKTRIRSSAYLPSDTRPNTYPIVFVAHPFIHGKLALGLSDGSLMIIYPPTKRQRREMREREFMLMSNDR